MSTDLNSTESALAQGATTPPVLDLVRDHLAGPPGRQYWRSLDELAETPHFRDRIHREFPVDAAVWDDTNSRRNFLKLMGASFALAGLTSCGRQPDEKILPYTKQPENMLPGEPVFYATALTFSGYAVSVLAESHMGRPTKIEGNPAFSGGASDQFAQAAILGLYDPDRSNSVLRQGRPDTWLSFTATADQFMAEFKKTRGKGLYILTESVTSPTLRDQMAGLRADYPGLAWRHYQPVNNDNVFAGTKLAFGQAAQPLYHFDKADVVLSIDADFLASGLGAVKHARDFATRRHLDETGHAAMNRLYVVETTASLTGGMADHRAPLRPSQIDAFTRRIAAAIGVPVAAAPETDLRFVTEAWLSALAEDLTQSRGRSIVIAGDEQSPEIHAWAYAMNASLGNIGQTLEFIEPLEDPENQTESLRALVDAMNAGDVKTLVILGGNPAYYAPADLAFGQALEKVAQVVHLGLYVDETADYAHWHLPAAHDLESWSDARAIDGTVSIVQPLILPLYGGKSAHEVLAALAGQPEASGHDLVNKYWQGLAGASPDFEAQWRTALADGYLAQTQAKPLAVSLQPGFAPGLPEPAKAEGMELVLRPDPTIYDGRYANNGWLQEVPKPLTKTTWDNAVLLSIATAKKLKLDHQQGAKVAVGGREVEGAVYVLPGLPDNTVTVTLGYGRSSRALSLARGAGFNAYLIRTSESPWFASGVEVQATGRRHQLARTEDHFAIEHRRAIDQAAHDRHLIREMSLADFTAHPEAIAHMTHAPGEDLTVYNRETHSWDGYKWGMTIDLNRCTGCNACIVACQAENNIPIVGKEQVAKGREMQWIRVDRYYSALTEEELANPRVNHQPVPCMQCENAPCEVVCPVAATTHTQEGLNDMVYNRCVGTRYCSNNCPYKVRRFNFLAYQKKQYGGPDWLAAGYKQDSLHAMRNPDVTIRSRGVMEKCTYCVQRINEARIAQKKAHAADAPMADRAVVTACQQACPAGAIVFGDLNNSESAVAKGAASPRNYAILDDLNTRPRTTYLAKLRNPNPKLEPSSGEADHGHGQHGNA